MTYDPAKSAQENEFTNLSTILADAYSLITSGDFHVSTACVARSPASPGCYDFRQSENFTGSVTSTKSTCSR
jgi:hypothetical protein